MVYPWFSAISCAIYEKCYPVTNSLFSKEKFNLFLILESHGMPVAFSALHLFSDFESGLLSFAKSTRILIRIE
jgi:hypothetical protein